MSLTKSPNAEVQVQTTEFDPGQWSQSVSRILRSMPQRKVKVFVYNYRQFKMPGSKMKPKHSMKGLLPTKAELIAIGFSVRHLNPAMPSKRRHKKVVQKYKTEQANGGFATLNGRFERSIWKGLRQGKAWRLYNLCRK